MPFVLWKNYFIILLGLGGSFEGNIENIEAIIIVVVVGVVVVARKAMDIFPR